MTLSQNDYYEYLSIHLNLLYFTGYYTGILEEEISFQDFLRMSFQQKAFCRNVFLENQEELLSEYIGDGTEIPNEQLAILRGFRKNEHGQFILLKCLKDHAILKSVDNGKFYAVKALSDSFEDLIPDFPVIFKLNILPFKGKIIYDGFIEGGNIKIGTHIQKSLNEEYVRARKNNEIVFSLD